MDALPTERKATMKRNSLARPANLEGRTSDGAEGDYETQLARRASYLFLLAHFEKDVSVQSTAIGRGRSEVAHMSSGMKLQTIMMPLGETVLSVTFTAAGIVPSKNRRFPLPNVSGYIHSQNSSTKSCFISVSLQ